MSGISPYSSPLNQALELGLTLAQNQTDITANAAGVAAHTTELATHATELGSHATELDSHATELDEHATLFDNRTQVSVKDYGATGLGIADDTVAIQAAVDAVVAAGGGIVLIPAGNYKTSATISITGHHVNIHGAGKTATTILPTGPLAGFSFAASPHPINNGVIENLTVKFTVAGAGNIGIDASNSTLGRFRNVLAWLSAGPDSITGFLLTEDSTGNGPYYNIFDGCDVVGRGTGSVGFHFASSGSFHGANANIVNGGHITLCDYAFNIQNGGMNVIDGVATESIGIAHYNFGAHATNNRIRTGYYEGLNTAYLCKFTTNGISNVVDCHDNRTTLAGLIDPASAMASNAVIIAGAVITTGNTVSIGATAVGGSVALSTLNWNVQLLDTASKLSTAVPTISFTGGIPTPKLTQDQASGTGSATGQTLTIQGQQGQAQTGVNANTTGATVAIKGGKAGTGGSGGAGVTGAVTIGSDTTVRVEANATGLGFFATAPIAKPTVSGSRGSNAALASLITALANLGLITDGSS